MILQQSVKRNFIILVLFNIHVESYCQVRTIQVNCNDSVLMSFKGTWKKIPDIPSGNISNLSRSQFPEVARRIEIIHNCLVEAYPQPIGLEASWTRIIAGDYLFAHNIYNEKGTRTNMFRYNAFFPYYTCVAYHPKSVFLDGETPNGFKVAANDLSLIHDRLMLDTNNSINGKPFYMRSPVKGTWKGYELIYCGENSRAVIIARKGELPYIPVTQKQYLDYAFRVVNKIFNESLNSIKKMPVRSLEEQEAEKKKALDQMDADYKNDPKRRDASKEYYLSGYQTDQQRRDESCDKLLTAKNDQVKRYEEELKKSIEANLLDSPAIVLTPDNISDNIPVFTTEREDGKMLFFENPAYIKKELPFYVPQFFVVYWSWGGGLPEYGGTAGLYFRKMIEANFPVQKLQAMIDK